MESQKDNENKRFFFQLWPTFLNNIMSLTLEWTLFDQKFNQLNNMNRINLLLQYYGALFLYNIIKAIFYDLKMEKIMCLINSFIVYCIFKQKPKQNNPNDLTKI